MSIRNLDHLLNPKRVVLIGASARVGSLGDAVLTRLKTHEFQGEIDLVNPKHRRIGDHSCHRRIADLPRPPDLGVIVTPPGTVPDVIRELGEAGARAAIVITGGIDAAQQQRMLEAARPFCLRILGPDCPGLQVPGIGLDASFAHLSPRPGNVALLSQSGDIISAMIDWAEVRGIGFSMTAAMGEMVDVDIGDLLDHLAMDTRTRTILMYLEQITHARKFMSAARAAARMKPVIVVKAGRSQEAARANALPMGAMAGSDDAYDAAFRRAGILRVDDLEDLFDATEVLARLRPIALNRLAILTNGGGAGVLATDAVARRNVRLATLSAETMHQLGKALPVGWSNGNPIVIGGDATAARFESALAPLLADRNADAVLVMTCPTGVTTGDDAARAVINAAATNPGKPLLAAWLGEATVSTGSRLLAEAGLPVFRTPAQAVKGFTYLNQHRTARAQLMQTPPSCDDGVEPDRDLAREILLDAIREGRSNLTEPEANQVLAAYGIPTVEARIAVDAEEAEAIAADLLAETGTDRVAIKVLSPDISHKTDVGGVRLNITGTDEAREATIAMLAHIAEFAPTARIEGVVVEPMVCWPDAHEVIVGLIEDRVFGPVMLFGAGGTSAEVMADKAMALPPLDLVLAEDMISRTRISKLLAGYCDRPAADLPAIAQVLVRLSQLSADLPEIRVLDINPLLADQNGVMALSARIVVKPCEQGRGELNPRFAIRPYPSGWNLEVNVKSGPIRIRPIKPSDADRYPEFIAKLTSEDMHMRFFGAFSHDNHDLIARFTQIDYARAMAFVALDQETGTLLGVARLAAEPDLETAEFALIVRSDQHRRGIGWALMSQLIDYATHEEIRELFGDILSSNTAMQRFCKRMGFSLTGAPEGGTVHASKLMQA